MASNKSLLVACVAILASFALVGCGSSKPGYCSARSNLESSIKALADLNVSSGVSGLKSHLETIKTDATSLANSAKSDFPNETSAITSSVDQLESAVKGVTSNPSASNIASLTSAASGLVTSVKNFTDSTSSKCS